MIDIDTIGADTERMKGVPLCGEVLLLGRDSDIAYKKFVHALGIDHYQARCQARIFQGLSCPHD